MNHLIDIQLKTKHFNVFGWINYHKGEKKTIAEKTELAKLGESQLPNMTLEEASSTSVYQFDGIDYRAERKNRKDNERNLRERRLVQYVVPPVAAVPALPKPPKEPKDIIIYLQIFQFDIYSFKFEMMFCKFCSFR